MNNIIRLDESGHILVEGQRLGKTASVSATAILVIDRSGSMAGEKSSFASAGAWDFSQAALNKGYKISVIEFATGALIVCTPSQNQNEIRRGCFADTITGSTQLHEGLRLALTLEPRSGDTVVVVTDGAVDDPPGTLALGTKLKKSGVEILAIGTDDADKNFLSKLASRIDLDIKVQASDLREAITDAGRLPRRTWRSHLRHGQLPGRAVAGGTRAPRKVQQEQALGVADFSGLPRNCNTRRFRSRNLPISTASRSP